MEVATERWRRIETLFHQAVEVDASERDVFLEHACQGDREMRIELDELLASSNETLFTLKDFVSATATEMFAGGGGSKRIGAYRLIRILGEGGMGVVYLAARDDDQYERLVAIKVIRASLGHSPTLQLRFRAERQILANLDHPNVARLLDGGVTEDGSPYLVMEYVDGAAIDVFCRERQLALDDRLRLFRNLCTAIDYAHRHLVVHRDIKPTNVLVNADGEPKLLDFGIAKLIGSYQTGTDPSLTRDNQRLLTPDYASPEQLLGKPVSTATDVFALGILLFELLTGRVPFPTSGASLMRQVRAICEDEAEKASVVCERERQLPPREARRLRGDLDNIIQKALLKDPEQRYASAFLLLADIDRYLSGQSVDASRQTLFYKLGKFVRRHQLGVGLTALMTLLIIGFGIGMGILARRASRGEIRARREEEFLASIFRAATPEGSKGESVTARQLLDRAAERVDTELSQNPQLQVAMAENIGQSYVALGMYQNARPLLEQALRLTGESHGQASLEYADVLSELGTDYRLAGDYEKAEPLFRRASAIYEDKRGANNVVFAHGLSNLGECLYLEDKDAEAEQTLRHALAIERPLDDKLQDGTRNYLALEIERKGAYSEAASLLREATDISLRVLGPESQDHLIALHNLAGAQIDMGDLEGAKKSEAEVLATRRKIWGPDHPDTAYSLNNLGWIYLELGQWQDAEPLLRENLEVAKRIRGGPGLRYAGALGNWGRVLQQKGDLAGAAASYDQAQLILTTNGRAESWEKAKLLGYQSLLELDRSHPANAIQLATRAVKMERQLGHGDNPQLASGLLALGLANLVANHVEEAETSFRGALAIRKQLYPPTHPEFLIVQTRLAEALLAVGRPQEALAFLERAIANAQTAPFPLPAWRMAELQVARGLALRRLGRESEATMLIAANADAIQGYNDAAVRNYLDGRIKANALTVGASQPLRHPGV